MTREQLWANTYIETVKKASPIQAESAATQAVKSFDKMFRGGKGVDFMPFDTKKLSVIEDMGRVTTIHVIATDDKGNQSVSYVHNNNGPTYKQEEYLDECITKIINHNDNT